MRRTNIYLEAEQTEKLDRLAAQEGVSRAEVIRRLLDRGLDGNDDDVTADLAIIDLSFGVLTDIDVVERGSGDRAAHLNRMWQVSSGPR